MSLLGKSLAAIFAVLLLATLVMALLRRYKPAEDWRELILRIRTWWIIVIFIFGLLLTPYWLALAGFALISGLALKEYLALVSVSDADRLPIMWMFIAIPVQYCLAGIGWFGPFIIFIPVYLFLFIPTQMVLTGETHGFLDRAARMHWGMMATVFAFSHVAFLRMLPVDDELAGALWVLFLVGLTELNDVAQYLWGKAMGRIKVTPKVSPNKTLAGLVGGIISTSLVAVLLGPIITPMSWPMALLAGVIIGITGFCGDVVMSAIKRDIGVKDTGTLLPGHGGVLDRLDSLLFTAPLFFHFIHYFYY